MTSLKDIHSNVLLTGASSGLGASFLNLFIKNDLKIYVTSRNPQNLPQHPNIIPMKVDLQNPLDVKIFLDKIQSQNLSIDLLINNAGAGVFAPFQNFPTSALDNQFHLMTITPIKITQVIYNQMLKNNKKQNTIISISSLAADFPLPYMPLYTAAKAALSAFTNALQLENKTPNLAIIDVQPGDFNTPFNKNVTLDTTLFHTYPFLKKIWNTLNHNLEHSPPPQQATTKLNKIILKRKSGHYKIGNYFQTNIAPLAARLLPKKTMLFFLKKYYNI